MGLGFLQPAKSQIERPYPCNDTKTTWEVFHDTTTFHGIICPFSSFVLVLEKAIAQCWKNKHEFCINSTSHKYIVKNISNVYTMANIMQERLM